MGLLTPYSVPRGGLLYTVIVPGGGGRIFAPFKSCPGGMILDETDTCIKRPISPFLEVDFEKLFDRHL